MAIFHYYKINYEALLCSKKGIRFVYERSKKIDKVNFMLI